MLIKHLPPFNKNVSTIIGLSAVLFWSTNVGLIREVSLSFGAVAGAALIYSVASIILYFTIGFPYKGVISKSYLIMGSLFFVACELCFTLSIGYAHDATQAIEVGMINYLWPTLTLTLAVIFNGLKANFLIIPGFILAFIGIGWVVSGDGLDLIQLSNNLKDNPISYILAFSSALCWAIYCTITMRISKGVNLVSLFFTLCAITLWIKYAMLGAHPLVFNWENIRTLLFASGALGLGYAAWNIGLLAGNVNVLAGASYFTPILSAFFAAIFLNTTLSSSFWYGVIMVTGGAICCWLATRKNNL